MGISVGICLCSTSLVQQWPQAIAGHLLGWDSNSKTLIDLLLQKKQGRLLCKLVVFPVVVMGHATVAVDDVMRKCLYKIHLVSI